MSKENEFKFNYTGGENTMKAKFDLETGEDYVEQDVTNYLEAAKLDRDRQAYFGLQNKTGYRKLATIPDIVALQLLTEHKLDLHDPDFMRNPANMKRLKYVLATEYRDLIINT